MTNRPDLYEKTILMKHSKSTALFLVGFIALAACTSNSSTPTTSATIAPTTTTTSTTVAPTTTVPPTTLAPITTKAPSATTKPKTTTTVPQNTTKSAAEILADAKAGMEAADTKFSLGGSFSDLVASKLQIEKRYASVGMKILPHATEQTYYNIKFSGVSNCFLADFDGSRSVFVPSACW